MWEQWKHAFAVNKETESPPTEQQVAMLDRLCAAVTQRKLTPAALAFLEMSRPLSYLGAQGMHFFEPIATAVFSQQEYRELAKFLERGDAVEWISSRLEALESGKDSPDSLACEKVSEAPGRETPTS